MPIIIIPIILFLLYHLERWVFRRYWDRNLEVELNFEKGDRLDLGDLDALSNSEQK